MNKLTSIIVDDELPGRENLKKIIENYCHEIDLLGVADSVKSAKKLVSQYKPEVVFLDISMPILDGFDFLEEYDKRNFMVVFVSAHEEFGIKAVKTGAVDYLLKPINIKELKQTIKKLLVLRNKNENADLTFVTNKLVVPISNGFEVLHVDNIIRLEADGCYTKVFVNEGKNSIVSRTLKDFEDSLPKEKFFRIHKSHLINLKFIKDYSRVDGYSITLTDGTKVEISRRKSPEFIQKIKATLLTV